MVGVEESRVSFRLDKVGSVTSIRTYHSKFERGEQDRSVRDCCRDLETSRELVSKRERDLTISRGFTRWELCDFNDNNHEVLAAFGDPGFYVSQRSVRCAVELCSVSSASVSTTEALTGIGEIHARV